MASEYHWTKEYILDFMTFPQIGLYISSFSKRKKIEIESLGLTSKSSKDEVKPIMKEEAGDFGLGYKTKEKEKR